MPVLLESVTLPDPRKLGATLKVSGLVVVRLASKMQIPSKDCGELFVCLCFNQHAERSSVGMLVPTWFAGRHEGVT